MKEIGGYLELERLSGKEYHEHMLRLNLGRTALTFLLEAADIHTLWVPQFLCGSVTEKCLSEGYTLKYYAIDSSFLPALSEPVPEGEYLYVVNFYGFLTDAQITSLQNAYQRIIVDNTHAFFARPLPGVPTIYSIRKFFGLPDGAYLAPGNLHLENAYEQLETDVSCGRMAHLLGRFEEDASTHYREMLDNAHALSGDGPKKMSLLTQNLLCGIDYENARMCRNENYALLASLLGDVNPLGKSGSADRAGFTAPDGPFTYPFYCRDGATLRKMMAQQKIFIPTYWSNVLSEAPADTLEYDYAANILPLPCDHRYGAEEMKIVAEALTDCIKNL